MSDVDLPRSARKPSAVEARGSAASVAPMSGLVLCSVMPATVSGSSCSRATDVCASGPSVGDGVETNDSAGGVGDGTGVAVDDGVGDGLGVTNGVGAGVGRGVGVGVGLGVGVGVGVGAAAVRGQWGIVARRPAGGPAHAAAKIARSRNPAD